MSLDTAVRGENATADIFFYLQDGVTPFPGVGGAAWVVRAPNGGLINSGIGQQDPTNPAHWVAQFSVPRSAPTTSNNEKYSIVWRISNAKSSQMATEYFSVTDTLVDAPDEDAIVALLGDNFNATVTLPYAELSTLSLRIIDNRGVVHLTATPSSINMAINSAQQSGSNYVYTIPISTSPTNPNYLLEQGSIYTPTNGIQGIPPREWFYPPMHNWGTVSLFAYWNYSLPTGEVGTIVYPIYLAHPNAVALMNDVRRFVDRIRNASAVPQLRITDTDLLHFVYKGLEDFNALPPSNSGVFGLASLPPQFTSFVRNAAIVNLLQAQYLGEGATMFDFTGQSVTLNVDQTQYLSQIISELSQDIKGTGCMASIAKNHHIRSGGLRGGIVATIGGNFGPVSNFLYQCSYPYAAGLTWLPMLPFV